jgi:transglutaminase-like putative cysteine protease
VLLTIHHRTRYRYARPVWLQPHRMMLRPRGGQDLRLLTTELHCVPPATIEWTQDVFGNLIATARFVEATRALTIDSRMVVDHSASAWPVFTIAPSAHHFPFAYSDKEIADLGGMRVPQYPQAADRVGAWLAQVSGTAANDTLTLLQTINTAIAAGLAYRVREEEGTQSPDDTIDRGSGSCRDFATLFIEAVRHLGFGAHAVSGYLQPDPAGDQHGTTHAWAEVYLPCAGWIPFDPTHGRMGGAGLIPVAIASDIARIHPVRGSYLGAPEDFLDMQVEVTVETSSAPAGAFNAFAL